MHAIGTEGNGCGRLRGGPSKRAFEGDQASVDRRLVAELHVVARQPRVRAHGPAIRGGDVPVDQHLVEDETGEAMRLTISGEAHAFAVVGRYVDCRDGHQLALGVFDYLGGNWWHVCVEELHPSIFSALAS